MKLCLGYLYLLLCSLPLAAQTTGNAFLDGQTIHDGIQIKFTPTSLSGQTAVTQTDSTGIFSVNLVPGVYEVEFQKSGYQAIFYLNGSPQFLAGSDTLMDVTLPAGVFKQISGTVSGTFDSDTVYLVTDELLVPDGQTLEIEPGTMVMFNGNYGLRVEGKILALGEQFLPISFVPNPSVGNTLWKGIRVEGPDAIFRADTARFAHVLVDRADVGIEIVEYGTGWSPTFVEITQSVIRHSSGIGMALTGHLEAYISENQVYSFNTAGISHATSDAGTINIECNDVHSSGGAGIYSFFSSGTVYVGSNYVHDLSGSFAYGIRPRKDDGNYLVENNLVVNCDVAIAETKTDNNAPNTVIQNNVVYNCGQGFNLTGEGGSVIRMNVVLDSDVGMIQFSPNFGTPSKVQYNSFFNNTQNFDGVAIPGLGNVVASNPNGNPSDVWFNLFSDPLISAPNVWYPALASPLIDAGDPGVLPDTNGTTADIGLRGDFIDCINLSAVATRVLTSSDVVTRFAPEVSLYPNPSLGQFRIDAPTELVSVEMYSMDGRRIDLRQEGTHIYEMNEAAKGLYLVRIQTHEGTATKRLFVE